MTTENLIELDEGQQFPVRPNGNGASAQLLAKLAEKVAEMPIKPSLTIQNNRPVSDLAVRIAAAIGAMPMPVRPSLITRNDGPV